MIAPGIEREMTSWKCICAALGFLLASTGLFDGRVFAQTIARDDFGDGSISDGSPIHWLPATELGLANGTFDASTGDLVLAPSTDAEVLLLMGDSLPALADASVRMQLRNSGANGPIDSPNQASGVIFRTDLQSPLQWVEGGIDIWGVAYLADGLNTIRLLDEIATDLRPLEEDVMLQFDAVGDTLRLFAWRASEAMPTSPLLESKTTHVAAGQLGLFYNPQNGNGTATFRSVEISTIAVPEPGSLTMCIVGLMGGFSWLRRSDGFQKGK